MEFLEHKDPPWMIDPNTKRPVVHERWGWILALFIIALIALPTVVVVTEAFTVFYVRLLANAGNKTLVRLLFIILVPIISLFILYLLYQHTTIFYHYE